MGESFFSWQSEGPDMMVIWLFVSVIICAISALCFFDKIKLFGVLIMSGVAVFAIVSSVWVKFHPDRIEIYEKRLIGFSGMNDFDVLSKDISAIESVVTKKTGGRGVYVFIKGGHMAKNIPMVTGERSFEYRKSLEKFCSINGIALKWSN